MKKQRIKKLEEVDNLRETEVEMARGKIKNIDFLALILVLAGILLLYIKNFAGLVFIFLGIIKFFWDK